MLHKQFTRLCVASTIGETQESTSYDFKSIFMKLGQFLVKFVFTQQYFILHFYITVGNWRRGCVDCFLIDSKIVDELNFYAVSFK